MCVEPGFVPAFGGRMAGRAKTIGIVKAPYRQVQSARLVIGELKCQRCPTT